MKPKWQPLPALMSPYLENRLNEFINVSKITPLNKVPTHPSAALPPPLSLHLLNGADLIWPGPLGSGASQTDGGVQTCKREGLCVGCCEKLFYP